MEINQAQVGLVSNDISACRDQPMRDIEVGPNYELAELQSPDVPGGTDAPGALLTEPVKSPKAANVGQPGTTIDVDEREHLTRYIESLQSCRDDLSRQQGQHKTIISKLEGKVNAQERQIQQKNEEITRLKEQCRQIENELVHYKNTCDTTPEKQRQAQQQLRQAAVLAETQAHANTARVQRLKAILSKEVCELGELLEFVSTEHQAHRENEQLLQRELQHAQQLASTQARQLASASEQLQSMHEELEHALGEVHACREENIELAMQASQQLQQLQPLQAAFTDLQQRYQQVQLHLASAQAEAAESKELVGRMCKQVKYVQAAMERVAASQKLPELNGIVKGLRDWMLTYHHHLSTATAPEDG